ncbi:MAG: carboxypeptidase-like regulatory domain-containing protein [Edaphobacter sp.]
MSLIASARAQTSDLSGELRDPSHALVPNALVKVTQDATGVVQETHTNGSGAYFFLLQPGNYSMDITATGFKPIHREDIVLKVAQPARLDFSLEVGGDSQTVTVEAGTEVLQESTSVGTTISEDEISRLPVNGVDGRNYTSLVLLTPGVSDVSVAGGDGTISGTNLYSVNGQRNQDNHYTLDGVDNNFLHKQSPGLSPPMDAMKEFRVATNNAAEFGRSAGANVALVTKSGGRKLHGSAYVYSRQALFDANDWFNDHNGIAKQPFHYAQFGASVGGPVVLPKLYDRRARTYWFFSYEGFDSRKSNPIESNVPTAAERGGNFSAISEKIYDPLTGTPGANGAVKRTAFAGNKFDPSRIDPIALAYITDFVPLPNLTTPIGNNNYVNLTPQRNNRNVFVGRIDHHFNEKNSVFFRVLDQQATQSTPQALPAFEEKTSFSGLNYVAGWDFIPGATDLLQVRFGYNNPQGPDVTRNTLGITRGPFFSSTGIQIFSAASPYDVLPSINAQDFSISETGGTSIDNIYELNATYNRSLGTALLKLGFAFQPRHYYHDATSPTSGTATFAVTQTNSSGLTSDTKTGSGTASFLLGYPASIDRGLGTSDVDATQKVYSFFAVYNRKIGQRLTAEVGLRYEFYLPATDKQNRLGTLWVHTDPVSNSLTGTLLWAGVNPLPDPVTGAVNQPPNQAGFGPGLQRTNYFNLMPRVGLAYLLDKHTILRAGYGIYDNSTAFQEVQDERKFYPYNFDQNFTTNAGVVPDTTLENTGPTYTNVLNLSGYAQDPRKKTPYSQQYNLTLERAFPAAIIAQVAYVGSENRHLAGYEPFNTAPVASVVPLPRILPQYGNVYMGANRYISNYNALQLLINKRYRAGLQFQANYTYGRSLDNQSSLAEMKTQDPFNPRQDYSRSSFDLTHIFNLSFVYDLPFGRGRRYGTTWPHLADDVIGGWSIESINRYETGPPVNVTLGGLDIANTGYNGSTEQRPNLSGDPNKGPKSISHWFNTAAFSSPALGTYGNSGAFVVQSDAIRRTDLSIYKRFYVVEGQSLDFRGEFFNLPNTPSFGSPKVNFESSGSFGTVTKVAVAARQVQLALRYTF